MDAVRKDKTVTSIEDQKGARWAAQDAKLRRLWTADVSSPDIAEQLGRSPGAVRNRAKALDLPARPQGKARIGKTLVSTWPSMSVQMRPDLHGRIPARKGSEYCRKGVELVFLLEDEGFEGTAAELVAQLTGGA